MMNIAKTWHGAAKRPVTMMGTLRMCGLLSALSLSAVSGRADPITITSNDGLGADAYVQRGNATTNYGNATSLPVKNSGGTTSTNNTSRKSYVRFDTTGTAFAGAGAADINGASFSLAVGTLSAGNKVSGFTFNVYGLADGVAGETFVEGDGGTDNTPTGEITFNNAPANLTSSNNGVVTDTTATNYATLLGTFTGGNQATNAYIVSLTNNDNLLNFLRQNSSGNNLYTFIITRVEADDAFNSPFQSGEGANAPRLTLDVQPVPEPGTFALMLSGLAATGVLRRKKNRLKENLS